MEDYLPMIAIFVAISVPIVGAFYAWLRSLKKSVDKNDKRGWRQSKALIILANRLDDIYLQEHKGKANLGPEIETILKDSNGDL